MNPLVADMLSKNIVDSLAPYCHQISVAGSIRRRRPVINDIDIVVIPKDPAKFRARLFRTTTAICDGPKYISVHLCNGYQLDVFIARQAVDDWFNTLPANWGSILLCRTGSKEHNTLLAAAAKKLGLTWDIQRGILDENGYIIASATEEEIFSALRLPYLPPEQRETTQFPSSHDPESIR